MSTQHDSGSSPADPGPTVTFDSGAAADTKSLADTADTGVTGAGAKSAPPLPQIPGYESLELIGRGGMGAVYKARDRNLKRFVALKVILAGAHASPLELARFRQEAEAIAQLQHPHIVQIFAVGEHEGLPFLALEFINGETLAQRIAAAPLSERDAAQLVQKLSVAIEAAHQHGIVHRDLKPANILMAGGVPKITDFGLAKQIAADSTQTASGMILGTPSYMAPEQARGDNKAVGPASDVYALGAILYELLTGRPPFKAANSVETVLEVLRDDPVPPSTLRPRLSRDIETICLKCLQKDAPRRYASAAALAEDLARLLAGEPIRARPVGQMARLWRWCRRKPLVASLIATVAVALVTVSAVASAAYFRVSDALQKEAAAGVEIRTQRNKALAAQTTALRSQAAAESALDNSDRTLLRSRQLLAQQYWLNNDVREAEEILDRCPPELRHWEWRYLKRLCHSELHVISDERSFASASYSGDGKWFVTGGDGGAVRVWDAQTLQPTRSLGTAGKPVASTAINQDGSRVAALIGTSVHVWNIGTGERVCELTNVGAGNLRNRLLFSPDSTRVVTPAGGVYDAISGKKLFALPKAQDIAYAPDGRSIATANASNITVFDADGKELRRFPVAAMNLTFSPNSYLIAATHPDGFEVIEAATGQSKFSVRALSDPIHDLCFSKNGNRIAAACGDRAVRVWDFEDRVLRATLRGHANVVRSVSFSADGERILSTSVEAVRLWKAEDDPETTRWRTGGGSLVFDPTRPHFVTTGGDVTDAVVRSIETGADVLRLKSGKTTAAAYSASGKWLATGGDAALALWNAESGEQVRTFPLPGTAQLLTFANDDEVLVSVASDNTLRMWDVATGENRTTQQLPQQGYRLRAVRGTSLVAVLVAGRILTVDVQTPTAVTVLRPERVVDFAISHDGQELATVHPHESGVQLWDLATGDPLAALPGKYAMGRVAFHPDGKRIAASTSAQAPVSQIIVWDRETQQESLVFRERGVVRFIAELAFSFDGEFLAGQGGTYTRRWDARPSRHDFLLAGSGGWAEDVGFFPDGKRLVSVGHDGAAHIWELARGHETATLKHRGRLLNVALTKDGGRLITSGEKVSVWDVAEARRIVEIPAEPGGVPAIALHPNQQQLAVSTISKKLQLFDLMTGEKQRELSGNQHQLNVLAFSHDGNCLFGIGSEPPQTCEVLVWNMTNGKSVSRPQTALIHALAPHPTAEGFATAALDGRICIWDAQGNVVQELPPQQQELTAIAWSPTGNWLAVGGRGRTVEIFEVKTGRHAAQRQVFYPVHALRFSPDGKWLAMALADDMIRLAEVDWQ